MKDEMDLEIIKLVGLKTVANSLLAQLETVRRAVCEITGEPLDQYGASSDFVMDDKGWTATPEGAEQLMLATKQNRKNG